MRSLLQSIKTIQSNVVGINSRNNQLIYPHNARRHYTLADDKIKAKQVLVQANIPCAATYVVLSKIGEIPTVFEALTPYSSIAIKPANGKGGGGIMILHQNREGHWLKGEKYISQPRIAKHMANIIMGVFSGGKKDRVLIEYCIQSHPFFKKIYPVGVPDFRVILLKQTPVMAMLRVPTEQSDGKANLHQGGLGIGIDLETGLLRQGFDGKKYSDVHPDSKAQISGLQVPYWKKIIAISLQTAQAFPLQYLGVDIVIDQELGPLIMEVNVRPGLAIQLVNKCGLREIGIIRNL